jgi:hypothetical protein
MASPRTFVELLAEDTSATLPTTDVSVRDLLDTYQLVWPTGSKKAVKDAHKRLLAGIL